MNKLYIDGSYFVFYRFFATKNWYKLQELAEEEDMMSNKVFLEKYDKMFEKTIIDLAKKYEVDTSDIYFFKDCPREKIWRNEHTLEYKGQRANANFDVNVFIHTYTVLLPNLIEKYGIKLISHDRLEADDLVALSIDRNELKGEKHSYTVITNDNDYIQLAGMYDMDRIKLINLQGKNLLEKNKLFSRDDVEKYLEAKVIMGDKSDNIPAISKKCGPKTAMKLVNDRKELLKLFEKDPQAKTQYDLNRLLIDFRHIDGNLKNEFQKHLI